MSRLAVVALAITLLPLSSSRLLCGVDLLMSNSMEVSIKLDCPAQLEQHQQCCTNHGACYIFRKPYQECDQTYCECVHEIAGKSEGVCQMHGENFCNIVKDTGRNVYDLHAM
ncbi:hypothetical protein KIN20_005150 [Parelaphostrongylus tenuis]|uniref:Uncharacterized protein n=1 Tax=Parelaphostrongylus tenuis TaxID=148309 RepID=A0AAD5MSD9_PARTN|nr:hypothetical protein KIN20_005150 [Parelaphostrongylus tenuis]